MPFRYVDLSQQPRRKKFFWVVLAVIAVLVLLHQEFGRPASLAAAAEKLAPRMPAAAAVKAVERSHCKPSREKSPGSTFRGGFVVPGRKDKDYAYKLYCTKGVFLGGGESLSLFFDAGDELVSFRYTASGGYAFTPQEGWGPFRGE